MAGIRVEVPGTEQQVAQGHEQAEGRQQQHAGLAVDMGAAGQQGQADQQQRQQIGNKTGHGDAPQVRDQPKSLLGIAANCRYRWG